MYSGTLERERAVDADAAAEILIMAHHDERTGIGFERLHQPIHRGNIEVIRWFIQHEQLWHRIRQKYLCHCYAEPLTTGELAGLVVHALATEKQARQLVALRGSTAARTAGG